MKPRVLLAVLSIALLMGVYATYCLSASATEPLPDLTVDEARLESSWDIVYRGFNPKKSCTVIEGCVDGKGRRKLLRFDVATPNIGTADVYLGDPRGNPLFIKSECHDHYHFDGYAEYKLIDATNATVVVGRKQAFCLLDSSQYLVGEYPRSAYHCFDQGISVGWQDVYSKELDCQWLDITNVAPGTYMLQVIVNPRGVFDEPDGLVESDYTNNIASVLVTITKRKK